MLEQDEVEAAKGGRSNEAMRRGDECKTSERLGKLVHIFGSGLKVVQPIGKISHLLELGG